MRSTFNVTSPIVWLLIVSSLAGTLSLYLFGKLQNERRETSQVLLDLPSGISHLSLTHHSAKSGCFASLSTSVTENEGQVTISMRAWLALSLDGDDRVYEATCDLLFNSLGQFGTSFCKTDIEGTEIRLGTTNIDPITLHVFVGHASTTPIIEQNLPGPIRVDLDGGRYLVTGPFNSKLPIPNLQELSPLTLLPPLSASPKYCDPTSHSALPIPHTVGKNLLERVVKLMPKGLL